MDTIMMANNGRLVVPAALRQRLGMEKGGKMVVAIRDDVLILEPFEAAVHRAQNIARSYLKAEDVCVVDEFLAERRAQEEIDG